MTAQTFNETVAYLDEIARVAHQGQSRTGPPRQPPIEPPGFDDDTPPMSDLPFRVTRLEVDVGDLKAALGRIEPLIARIDERLAHVATKTDLAALENRLEGKIAALDTKMEGKIAALDNKLEGKIAALDNKLEGQILALDNKVERRIATLESRVLVALESKPSRASMWGTGIALCALTVAAMAAGAIYLPLVMRLAHVSGG